MKIGDSVRLRDSSTWDWGQTPGYSSDMEFGGFAKITGTSPSGYLMLDVKTEYVYNENWLSVVYIGEMFSVEDEIRSLHKKMDLILEILGACERE